MRGQSILYMVIAYQISMIIMNEHEEKDGNEGGQIGKRTRNIDERVIRMIGSGFQNTNCYIWIFAQPSIGGDNNDERYS